MSTKKRAKQPKAKTRKPRSAPAKAPARGRPSRRASPKRKPAKTVRAAKSRAAKPRRRAATAKPKAKATSTRKKATRAREVGPHAVVHRDGSGHLQAEYAAGLRALSVEGHPKDEDRAFLDEPRTEDDLAEELGEAAVSAMTSGEDEGEEALDQQVPEEQGGPFVVTTGGTEFAEGVDPSNPKGAKREPFPTT